jgi:glutathione S-transferase
MIVVHHLNNSRSQRIVWLLEELGVPYQIESLPARCQEPISRRRNCARSTRSGNRRSSGTATWSSRNPARSSSTWSSATGNGSSMPPRGTPEHVRYLHWMHFAEGTIMLHLLARLYLSRVGEPAKALQARVEGMIGDELDLVEAELGPQRASRGERVQRRRRADDVSARILRVRAAHRRAASAVARLSRAHAGAHRVPASRGERRGVHLRRCERGDAAPFPIAR